MLTWQEKARAFCRRLDAMWNARPSDEEEERLIEIGELAGGLSTHGFEYDVQACLVSIEIDILDDAPALPWRHPSDPDISQREADLHADIFDAKETWARTWLEKATAAVPMELAA